MVCELLNRFFFFFFTIKTKIKEIKKIVLEDNKLVELVECDELVGDSLDDLVGNLSENLKLHIL